ncbi:MAG: hypothetical protein ACYDH3_07435 [Candidatus Aminicenantales bacterium]
MKRRVRSARRFLGLSAVVVYLGFVAAAALPGIVFCYRSGGRVAVEIAGPSGACSCNECEHCLERLSRARYGAHSDSPILEACHCSHETILISADRSALRRDDGFRAPATAHAGCHSPAAVAVPGWIHIAVADLSPLVFPSFSGRTPLLRC